MLFLLLEALAFAMPLGGQTSNLRREYPPGVVNILPESIGQETPGTACIPPKLAWQSGEFQQAAALAVSSTHYTCLIPGRIQP